MGPQRILWALVRRAWGLNGSCGHKEGANGASTDPGGTREARMGPQRILGAHGRRAWGLRGSWGHMGGMHEASTVRSMVTEPTEERGGDQRYLLPMGLSHNMG